MANFQEMAMFFAINNVEEHANYVHNERQTRNREYITDPFTLSDRLFIKNFRLTKDAVRYLIDLLRPHIISNTRSSAIDLNTKIFSTLNFLATGCYQSPIGNSKLMVLSQPTVSRCISEVVAALNLPEIFQAWVRFPKNLSELSEIRNEFYKETGFPGIIGCVDCTHVAIVPPSTNLNLNENQYPEYIYVNRKGYHSINVQLICDSKLNILNVNALFPGSTHDIHVWNNSSILQTLQELHRRNHKDFFLLGDSGYPLRQWLLTPIANPTTNAEIYYNQRQMSSRSIIERCNGVLKMRFRMEPSSDISIESVEENILKSSLNRVRKRKKQLYTDLKKQMEFYLSDANLRKDRYFGNLMQTSQCISIETFLNCNKIKSLTKNPEDIIKAIESSSVLSVSDCKSNIYRIKPIEEKKPEDVERCTVYVEQLPPKADHDWIKSMFEKYGSVAYISLPKFKSGTIKRFAFIEFDNEESAIKVLEEYKKLHEESKILPEELQSIITFKEDEDKKDTEESADNVNLLKKRKHSVSIEDVKEKKLKTETPQVSCSGIKNNKKKKKKDKTKKSDLEGEQKNSSFEISDSENNQKTLIKNHDTSISKPEEIITSDDDKKEINIEPNNTDTNIKKKRKRNKGKKVKLDTNLTSPVLRIMSKTEWRKLRNQFLNMQRQKMSLLKAQLRRPKYNDNFNTHFHENSGKSNQTNTIVESVDVELPKNNDIRVKYEPGVILKISFANPIESDKIFKAEAKIDPRVKFVDVVHNSEAYVRCDCQETAIKIAEENRWPQTRLLTGEEEKLYWDKISRDREIKCTKQKETKKPRGREKLIKKAEKRLAQHVTFNQEDNE